MFGILTTISRFLSAHTPIVVIAAAVISFFAPTTFAWVSGFTQTAILGFIMLTMGLTLTTQDMKVLATRPWDLAIGAFAQFGLMPLIAWILVHFFHLDTAFAVGIILVGCCPGGVSSNIMSYLCKGDVAYSVGMTTVSTLLAPVVTPALVLWLAGKTIAVDTVGMFINILIVTIIPVGIGFLGNLFFGKKEAFKKAQSIMPSLSVLGLACIVGGVISAVHSHLLSGGWALFGWTFLIVFLHNGFGYVTGYTVGKLFSFSKAKKRTLSIEVGMQNAGLATNLASTFFMASCPLSVVPCAISCAWHSISGTLLASLFAWKDKVSHKNENK
jgi:BASS family bile acid:Na+ symporter